MTVLLPEVLPLEVDAPVLRFPTVEVDGPVIRSPTLEVDGPVIRSPTLEVPPFAVLSLPPKMGLVVKVAVSPNVRSALQAWLNNNAILLANASINFFIEVPLWLRMGEEARLAKPEEELLVTKFLIVWEIVVYR